jgi:hypothetical protein
MQKWLSVVVLTLAVMVAAMGVRNLTVKASSGNLDPTVVAWGGVPAPPTPYLKGIAAWGGVPAPPTPYVAWGGVPAPPTPYLK